MGLIEGWRKIAQLNLSATSVLDNNNARGFGMALASAAADLESACTPRPPKVEYFGAPVDADGKPTKKWDSWWFEGTGVMRGCTVQKRRKGVYIDGISEDGNDVSILIVGDGPLSLTTECIPVRREGPPAMDVSWDVVGG